MPTLSNFPRSEDEEIAAFVEEIVLGPRQRKVRAFEKTHPSSGNRGKRPYAKGHASLHAADLIS